ncbi:hypothetical protein REPUB_Repub04eG0083600 [Reevesia pubescens]
MDSMGAILGEWGCLSGMYTNEETDFMAQLLGSCPIPDELDGSSNSGIFPSTFWPAHHSIIDMTGPSYCSSDIANSSLYSFSQGSSYSAGSSILFPSSSQESYYLSDSHPIFVANNSPMSMDFSMEDATNTSSYLVEADDCLNQDIGNGNVEQAGKSHQESAVPKNLEAKRKSKMPQPVPITEKKSNNISENSKKRARSSGDVQKNRRNAKSKKNQSSVSSTNNDEDGNAGLGQSSASCSSENDSNASQELNEGLTSSSKGEAELNLNGKTRASRREATDSQSLYARTRRERINERLRVLQNLVPNGTKVDISTMLEEAVQYVKFLQLQIKLLSSDDLWMYAPIAYNGMDIGLDLKVPMPKRS